MKQKLSCLIFFIIFMSPYLSAQQFTAYDYWKMEQDSSYQNLLRRQNSGETLTDSEKTAITVKKTKLDDYFSKMSDQEKAFYYQNRANWSQQPGTPKKVTTIQEENVYAGERSFFSRYLATSGVFGYFYGWATIGVFGIESEGFLVGFPFLTAGASALLPLITIKDRYVSPNSLQLSLYGKSMGAFQGAALGVLFTGENAGDNPELILGLATLTSIGLGHYGFHLGKVKPWSQGRVALYTHYGTLIPIDGLALLAAFQSESPSLYAATFMGGNVLGYYIADKVADKYDYTKGDITSTQTLAFLNAGLGFGLIPSSHYEGDFASSDLLLPALGALGGTIAGHFWLKDARLSNQQGRNTALAAAGGAVIGLGATALFTPESPNPYFLMSYATGMTTYALIVSKYKKQNQASSWLNEKPTRWNISLMPQNIFLNKEIASRAIAHPEKRNYMLPAFSASLTF
jgi:hypothetical protein